jgi:hypothetical protein
MRLRLEYGDQNESFAKVLPVAGTVARRPRSKDGGAWVLFQLDAPATYEGIPYAYFLLRSRWLGMEIGDTKPTSVFILLVADQNEAQDGFDVHDFPHVAWGMTQVL